MGKKLSLEEIKELYTNENRIILDIESREYGNNGKRKTHVKYRCLIDGYEDWMALNKMKQGQGCSICGGHSHVPFGNSIKDIRPDLIEYLVNKDDSIRYTVASNAKMSVKCPKCGMIKSKQMSSNTLSKQGFSCEYCSNKNSSLPERFGINLFKQLNLNFETQKVFEWAKDKRYDKYFILNDEEFLCEIMGNQHYEECSLTKRSLKEEQENDIYKNKIALQNGIKPENYIIINARYSKFEWLKENFSKELSNIFDLSNIDWIKVWKMCQDSLLLEVCEFWENRNENETTSTVVNKFCLDKSTIIKYLKIGNEIGKCVYDSRIEMKKSSAKIGKNSAINICQYSLNGEFIKAWHSATEAGLTLGIGSSHISSTCTGNRQSAGGFIWKHNKLNSIIKE